jgi:uncharacterized membrane protein YedE/YeeE
MTAAIATLILGFVIGFLGQRSRLCFISGYRDYILTRDTSLLKGVAGTFIGALAGFIVFGILDGTIPGFPQFFKMPIMNVNTAWWVVVIGGLGVGFVGALSGGCPFRMHILAAEGKKTYWFYLLGFYVGLIFFNTVTVHLVDFLKSIK